MTSAIVSHGDSCAGIRQNSAMEGFVCREDEFAQEIMRRRV